MYPREAAPAAIADRVLRRICEAARSRARRGHVPHVRCTGPELTVVILYLMTNDERITVIRNLGYSERQAAFLCLAALHGGYFLRRQYTLFLGQERGGNAERFIERAIRKRHVRAHESANRTIIYHIGAKPFFEAIGEVDKRNRRRRQPYSIKIKLMGFDYVLAHREHHEKLDYFSGTLGID